jgi:hypothetical protein
MKRSLKLFLTASAAIAAVLATSGGAGADPAIPTTVCTWGGTPDAPTGEVMIEPGLTLTPSSSPHELVATGPLAGGEDCKETMTFRGIAQAGSTCANTVFEGRVHGVPGVESFFGPGVAGFVQEFLYDKDGNVVGADQPQVLNQDDEHSQGEDCATPEGFTHGRFSSTVEFYGGLEP